MSSLQATGARIAIRSRTTVGEQQVSVALAAACPVQARDVPLAECAACPRCVDLHVGDAPRDLSLSCRIAPDEIGGPDAAPGKRVRGGADAGQLPIAELMTSHVVCVRPDLPVTALEALLLERGISGVPVVDDAGRPLGVVSSTDVMRHHHDAAQGLAKAAASVNDIMMPMALCLPANDSVAKAAALMAFEQVHRIPVVGPSGAVVGLLSPVDVLRWLAREQGYVIGNRG